MIRYLSWTFIAFTFLFVAFDSQAQTSIDPDDPAWEGECQGLIAFPGARGYGKCATGWRGGRIIRVTNTNDSGAGSLRNCVEDSEGPRVCIFDTGGTIELTSNQIFAGGTGFNEGGDLYIAGQSAPEDSGGIQIKLSDAGPNLSTIAFLQVDHILMRHIRLRPGAGDRAAVGDSISGFTFRNVRHFMVDHVSVSYASDQNMTVVADNFDGIAPIRGKTHHGTIQNSITSYGLHAANHTDVTHSKGALLCPMSQVDLNNGDRCGYISMIENLFAHNNDRNPELKMNGDPYELVNNFIYNASSEFAEFDDELVTSDVSLLGNVAKEGPNTRDVPAPHLAVCRNDVGNAAVGCNLYLVGNIDSDNLPTLLSGAQDLVVDSDSVDTTILGEPFASMVTGPRSSAEDLDDYLLTGQRVGATAPALDALDQIAINDALVRTGQRVNFPEEVLGVGLTDGYPTLAAGTPHTDTDNDGMPDDWEIAMDGSEVAVNRFNAWGDRDGDGWSNLEEYLNFRAGDIPDPRP